MPIATYPPANEIPTFVRVKLEHSFHGFNDKECSEYKEKCRKAQDPENYRTITLGNAIEEALSMLMRGDKRKTLQCLADAVHCVSEPSAVYDLEEDLTTAEIAFVESLRRFFEAANKVRTFADGLK